MAKAHMREDVNQQKLAFYKYRMKTHTDEIKKHLAQFGVTRARDTFDRDRRTRRSQRLDVLAVRSIAAAEADYPEAVQRPQMSEPAINRSSI